MAKKYPEELQGKYITDENGVKYFVMGNTRTRVTEYFKEDGPTLEDVIVQLILSEVRQKTTLKPL